ncbi:MAG: hypothetical protein JXQ71_04535 [Verrucomicrobia bacterium]|nr:hypothetical protein [Verrucomicrobiota bacterium]
MKKPQYFVHYRDDGPRDVAAAGDAHEEARSCLFVFDDLEGAVTWQEQDYPQLIRHRANARIENRWSTRYNSSPAHAVHFVKSAPRPSRRRPRSRGALLSVGRASRRFVWS